MVGGKLPANDVRSENMDPNTFTAAESLEGLALSGGWTVVKKIKPSLTGTGGNFCVQYHVQHEDGRVAFCKALDLSRASSMPDPARIVQVLVEGFNFERDLLNKCRARKLSR